MNRKHETHSYFSQSTLSRYGGSVIEGLKDLSGFID